MLVDLPGFQRPRDALTERMQGTVDAAFEDVDAVLFVVDCRDRIGAGDRFIAERVFALDVPVVIALNKVDRLKGGHIAQQMTTAAKLGQFHALHPVSAKTGDGIGELRDELVSLLDEGPAYFPTDSRTDLPVEAQIAEIVRRRRWFSRAKRCRTRSTSRWRRSATARSGSADGGDGVAEADRRRQGGRMVREIGTRARPEIEALLGVTGCISIFRSRSGRTGAATGPRSTGYSCRAWTMPPMS